MCMDASFEALKGHSEVKCCAIWTRRCSFSEAVLVLVSSHSCRRLRKSTGRMASTPWDQCLTPRCQLRRMWLISACLRMFYDTNCMNWPFIVQVFVTYPFTVSQNNSCTSGAWGTVIGYFVQLYPNNCSVGMHVQVKNSRGSIKSYC
jgi:hypothetical protein